MTNSLQGHLNLVIQEESTFDNVYKDLKGLIKTQKEILTQAIEEGKGMDKEKRKAYHELFVVESISLTQSLKDVNALLKQQKEKLVENFRIKFKERESKELWNAVYGNDLFKTKALLMRGNANVNWQNDEEGGETVLMRAVLNDSLEITLLLIANKADVNIRDVIGITALFYAYNNIAITKLLVGNGAKVDFQGQSGNTALIYACSLGCQEVASFLLAEGACHTFEDNEGHTAECYALEYGWNWDAMIAEANLSYFDHVFDCMVNADYSPLVEKKKGGKRGEEEKEKKEELPFLLRFMKKVINSDFMMSKNVFPKLSFNPGAEAGEGNASILA